MSNLSNLPIVIIIILPPSKSLIYSLTIISQYKECIYIFQNMFKGTSYTLSTDAVNLEYHCLELFAIYKTSLYAKYFLNYFTVDNI